MALPDIKDFRNKAAAAGLAGLMAIAPMTATNNNAYAAEPTTSTTETTLTPELQQLRKASRSSRAFAEENFGIGIVLHGGADIPHGKIKTYEQLANVYTKRYQELLDEQYPGQQASVRVFIAPNDNPSSLVSINIGDQIYKIDNIKYDRPADVDPALLDLQTAWSAAPEIVSILPLAKVLQEQNEDKEREWTITSPTASR